MAETKKFNEQLKKAGLMIARAASLLFSPERGAQFASKDGRSVLAGESCLFAR